MAARQFLSAVSEILKDGAIYALVGIGIRYLYLRSKFPCAVLENLRSGADNSLFPSREILTSHLGTEEVQPDVADDFVECPAASIGTLEMISNCDVAVWIGSFLLSQRLAVWRVLWKEYAFNVFVALAVVPLFGEPVNRNVVEVPGGHYGDAQRRIWGAARRRSHRGTGKLRLPAVPSNAGFGHIAQATFSSSQCVRPALSARAARCHGATSST